LRGVHGILQRSANVREVSNRFSRSWVGPDTRRITLPGVRIRGIRLPGVARQPAMKCSSRAGMRHRGAGGTFTRHIGRLVSRWKVGPCESAVRPAALFALNGGHFMGQGTHTFIYVITHNGSVVCRVSVRCDA
jgi:hypothetical protein